ncbi:MAG: ASCH domain-containing protein [Candidatus Aenigmarchaeota archaeon]|nr:ASCH domain-containing protein [Candidatus Aenigmarchaeota archaeon]
MHHVAIMRKSWGLIQKILSGEKTVESRWYKSRYPPWNKISSGDTIYFKDSGEPVSVKAKAIKVLQFDKLTSEKTKEIFDKYGKSDLGVGKLTNEIPREIKDYMTNKNYCILVFFDSVEKVEPFEIDKSGFGSMAAWICAGDIRKIRV